MIRGFLPRILGDVRGSAPGPTLVVICAMHGNEPAGVIAAQQVMPQLEKQGILRGRVVALVGNRAAVVRGERCQVRDLNRAFTADQIEALHAQPESADDPEQIEARAVLACLDDLAAASDRPLVLLDLHTTSGGGPPFSVVPDALFSRELAAALPFPAILGLLESIDGTLLSRMTARGHVGIGIETGQHADPLAAGLHAASIWRVLAKMRMIKREPKQAATTLNAVDPSLPAVVEHVHRHAVQPEDQFRMRPGFKGFQRIERGQILADDVQGPVVAHCGGRILMPLYQRIGSDGFFITRDVPRAQIMATVALRRLGAWRLLPLLPGVKRAGPDTLQVAEKTHRLVASQLKLFGYRRPHSGAMMRAREPDTAPWK